MKRMTTAVEGIGLATHDGTRTSRTVGPFSPTRAAGLTAMPNKQCWCNNDQTCGTEHKRSVYLVRRNPIVETERSQVAQIRVDHSRLPAEVRIPVHRHDGVTKNPNRRNLIVVDKDSASANDASR